MASVDELAVSEYSMQAPSGLASQASFLVSFWKRPASPGAQPCPAPGGCAAGLCHWADRYVPLDRKCLAVNDQATGHAFAVTVNVPSGHCKCQDGPATLCAGGCGRPPCKGLKRERGGVAETRAARVGGSFGSSAPSPGGSESCPSPGIGSKLCSA